MLVYDFGGGTLDVSIVEIHPKNITIKAIAGDSNLGGRDIDNRIVEKLTEEYAKP